MTTTTTTTYRAGEIPAAQLQEKPLAPPTATPLDGEVLTRSQVFYATDDSRITFGTWECEPGRSRWEFLTRGEAIHVLSGRMTIEPDGGEPSEIVAGTSAIFPMGWCGTWTVHETLRKVYVIYRD